VGADHMMNMHDTAFTREGRSLRRINAALEQPVGPVPRDELNEDKLAIFIHELNWMHFHDCALICQFYDYNFDHLAEALSGVSGVEYDIHDVLAVGARAQTLARLLNLREGFTAEDDRLPERVMRAFDEGPIEGSGIAGEDLDRFKRRYYEVMKWDPETGAPTAECLRDLGIGHLLGK
jgi:aldehyde:ferredoxin oxidoreductase